MTSFKTLAKSMLLALLGVSTVSADAPALASFCAATAAEAPEACVGAIIAAIAAWGLEEGFADTPYDQRADWIQGFIDNASTNAPGVNTMAIATYYNNPFEHGSGVGQVIGDCGHTHHEIPMRGDWGVTQGVEIYTVGQDSNCCVEKWGDGGWTNWGWYGSWSQTTTASGSLMMCLKSQPPPQPVKPQGVMKYIVSPGASNLVTVNGIVGRFTPEGGPLFSFNTNNALYKEVNSATGPYYQAIMQTDGNFVVKYFNAQNQPTPVFWTNTGGQTNNPNWELVPQHDGNLVIYHSDTFGHISQPTWASQTSGINVQNGWVGLVMQQDGNLVMYVFYPDGSCDPIWATNNHPPTGSKVWPHAAVASSNRTDEAGMQKVLQAGEL